MASEKDKARLVRWRNENRERLNAQVRARYKKDPAPFKARSAKWEAKNRERELAKDRERMRALYQRDPERFRERARVAHANNRDANNAAHAKRMAENPHLRAAHEAARRARIAGSTPMWANQFFIAEIYDLAQLRTKITGYKWEVDHIVPLQSALVCGLHVESNMRVIPAAWNRSKKNRWWPDMPNPIGDAS